MFGNCSTWKGNIHHLCFIRKQQRKNTNTVKAFFFFLLNLEGCAESKGQGKKYEVRNAKINEAVPRQRAATAVTGIHPFSMWQQQEPALVPETS